MEPLLSFKPVPLIVCGLLAAVTFSGCAVGQYKSNFPVVVENRAANAIQVMADGNSIGQVASGQTSTFNIQLAESNANVFTGGVAPTPQAQVTFTAKDTKTGALSAEKSMTLSQASSTYVTFSSADFPSTVATIARMVVSPSNPTINQDVSFNASTSTGSNLTYGWDFGDGQTGTGVIVTHQFTRGATYRVVLTVTNDSGQSNSTSTSVTVSAAPPQVNVNFTFSPTTPAINQDVVFTIAGTTGGAGTTFAWDFGDGDVATTTTTTTTHRYARASTFTVTLRVTASVGQPATASRTITVTAVPTGTVNFTFSPTTPGVTDTVFFNAALTTIANATFAWDFGDGSSGSGVAPTHAYSRSGTYAVTLTATNDLRQSASVSKTITVSATSVQLVASFTFSPTAPGVNDPVYFNGLSSTGATAGAWDFGDGSSDTGGTPVHQYTRAGTYTVTLTVSNSLGQTSATSKTITVAATSTQLVASFTLSPTAVGVNDTVFLNASSSTGANATFAWDFGDGSSGTGLTPTHRYTRAGTYTITLTASNGAGQTSSTSKPITVSATSTQFTAEFTFSPTTPGVGDTVFLSASSSAGSGATFAWDFGDGSTGTGATLTHPYTRAGTYTITLTASSSAGQTASVSKTITVSAPVVPVAGFTFSPTTPVLGDTVFFNASSSTGTNLTYAWDFGDGTSGTGASPTRVYTRATTFTVTLTVTSGQGQSASTSKTVTVAAQATFVAAFTFSPTDPSITRGTNTVAFDATPSSAGVTTWTWDFGDGSSVGSGQKVTQKFLRSGTWVVRLTVTDAAGRTATTTSNVTVAQ